jgi:hypothetical protein
MPSAVRHRAVWIRPGRPTTVARIGGPVADPAPRPTGRHQARPRVTTHVSAHVRHKGALGWDGCAPTSTRPGTHHPQHGFSLRPLRKVRAAPRMGPLLRPSSLNTARRARRVPRRLSQLMLCRPCNSRRVAAPESGSASRLGIPTAAAQE